MITPKQAWAIILDQTGPLEAAAVPLGSALGRSLAEDIRADRALPPADRSSADGYAVRLADLRKNPCVLRVVGEVAAGSPLRPRVRPGACVRIFTGGNVPPGADAVVKVEQTEEMGGLVTIRLPVEDAPNILSKGEDARRGAVLLSRGTWLDAMKIGVCAAVGKGMVRVHRLPQVTILCTGSELRRVEDRVQSHEIRNSNGPTLCAALEQWGFPRVRFRSVADKPVALVAALKSALERFDVVLFTGGVSVGRYDFVRQAVETAGAKVRFHRVRMRPGKPTLYATAPKNRHIFGLPGNPLSSLTAFHEFALPALRRLAGCPAGECRLGWPLPLAESAKPDGVFVRCILANLVSYESSLAVAPVTFQSSADLVSAGHADGVILLPVGPARIEAGGLVTFRAWRPLA